MLWQLRRRARRSRRRRPPTSPAFVGDVEERLGMAAGQPVLDLPWCRSSRNVVTRRLKKSVEVLSSSQHPRWAPERPAITIRRDNIKDRAWPPRRALAAPLHPVPSCPSNLPQVPIIFGIKASNGPETRGLRTSHTRPSRESSRRRHYDPSPRADRSTSRPPAPAHTARRPTGQTTHSRRAELQGESHAKTPVNGSDLSSQTDLRLSQQLGSARDSRHRLSQIRPWIP